MKPTLIFYLACLLLSCSNDNSDFNQSDIIIGEGPVVSKDYHMASFSSVSILSFTNIIIETGKEQQITISGQKNILDVLEVKVADSNLDLTFPKRLDIRPTEDLTATITMPVALKSLSFVGMADIELSGAIQNSLSINITGSGNVNTLDLPVNNLIMNWTGEGSAHVNAINQLIVNCVGVFDIWYKGEPTITNNSVGTISISPEK